MGGGILPVAYHNNNIYLFFGRETLMTKGKQSGLWSDFGGSKEGNETTYDTAIREGHEETSGILGNIKRIKYLVDKKLITTIKYNGYASYLIAIKYNKELPNKLRHKFLRANTNDILEHNGLYEKDMGKWINIKYLIKHIKKFRPWYKRIVYAILRQRNTIIDYFNK